MSSSVQNIKIEPVNVFWQAEQQTEVVCVADVGSSLNNKYFKIASGVGGVGFTHYVWMNVDSAGVDPAVAGLTGIPVVLAEDASATAVATAVAGAVGAVSAFTATASGSKLLISNAAAAEAAKTEDAAAPNATGFTFVEVQQGGNLDCGLIDGDIEASFEEQTFEVTAHQTGTTVLADLRQGVSATLSLTLKESDTAKLKEVFSKAAGGVHTPSGGTELFGWGTARQGSNTVIQARRLVLHPVRLPATDYKEDLCFWKAYPLPETLTFSGENPKVCAVSFKTYLDDAKPKEIKLFAFGDWSQLVP
jgi:hypothetical protein